jgi:GMP synthase (glutamine-hydrolysing)
MKSAGLYEKIWQFPVVLLPIGIHKGGQSIVLRPICSVDAMTADAFCLPDVVFDEMTEKIVAIDGIDLVFLDLTNKPPGTIEWE